MATPPDLATLRDRLSEAGFLAADEEAAELLAAAVGNEAVLEALLYRRLTGEPLAWITGRVSFCGTEIRITSGVYVPRWQSEALARRAVGHLPEKGVAIDLCTGSGAIARMLSVHCQRARVVASEIDERAVACAADNGVEVYLGDLFDPLPSDLAGRVDVIVGVVPYVPTPALPRLQRDTLTFESALSYDGGPDGTDVLRRTLNESRRFLLPGGTLILELGGDQAEALRAELDRLGYIDVAVVHDEDGDLRGIDATWPGPKKGRSAGR
ncbi:MAG: peptide chain release factor N(5)-glutamine methyltransferase [Actinomycetota bacterium]|nr:peptide chain release factor N(5)-glutamine methyltransferase [Actinomycetota bacterium]